ncbi:hypothetical protein OPV22_007962 [Ensete ventricosum]|uniref:Secreted protein n=1 Tax=Ensete ventricosum TaxID=4639 RepID=A0AAV8PN80_ENSVE|nr:hypothetical protein OPV22_007962 [Ensete ventricosum]
MSSTTDRRALLFSSSSSLFWNPEPVVFPVRFMASDAAAAILALLLLMTYSSEMYTSMATRKETVVWCLYGAEKSGIRWALVPSFAGYGERPVDRSSRFDRGFLRTQSNRAIRCLERSTFRLSSGIRSARGGSVRFVFTGSG